MEQSHGFFGSDPISPNELIARARSDLKLYPQIDLLEAKVWTVTQLGSRTFRLAGDDFEVRTSRLVIATGVVDRFPEVEGFFEHYGADVFHCPLFDGYEAEGKHVVAAVLWILASLAFGFYVSNFATYSKTYGPMAGVIVLILWLYLSALSIMVGGELNAELERQSSKS